MFYAFNLKKYKKIIVLLLFTVIIFFGVKTATSIVFPLKHIDLIEKYSKEYDLETSFVCAVIHAESKFKKTAKSNKGASGLMQLTEPTANWIAEKMNLQDYDFSKIFEPEINIKIGCYYLKQLKNQFNDDEALALAAYNAGSGNVSKWLNNKNYSRDGKSLTNIPFKETREYIKRVNFNEKIYSFIIKIGFYGGTND